MKIKSDYARLKDAKSNHIDVLNKKNETLSVAASESQLLMKRVSFTSTLLKTIPFLVVASEIAIKGSVELLNGDLGNNFPDIVKNIGTIFSNSYITNPVPQLSYASGILLATSAAFKNTGLFKFSKKQKEEAAVLMGLFDDDLSEIFKHEDDLLTSGVIFSVAAKKYYGKESKFNSHYFINLSKSFFKGNESHLYSINKPTDYFENTTLFDFIKKTSNNDFTKDVLKEYLDIKRKQNPDFEKKDAVDFIYSKIEKSFIDVYKEKQLQKTAIICCKMLLKADKNPEEFIKIYNKNKDYFTMKNFSKEIPECDKSKYVEFFRIVDKAKNKIEKDKPYFIDRKAAKKNMYIFKKNFNKNVLDLVYEKYSEEVKLELSKGDLENNKKDLTKENIRKNKEKYDKQFNAYKESESKSIFNTEKIIENMKKVFAEKSKLNNNAQYNRKRKIQIENVLSILEHSEKQDFEESSLFAELYSEIEENSKNKKNKNNNQNEMEENSQNEINVQKTMRKKS
jgi:hypothetical protein